MDPANLAYTELNGNTIDPKTFCVDRQTGFVPPQMPLGRLPGEWEIWEAKLDAAKSLRLKAAEQTQLMDVRQKHFEEEKARGWRKTVEKMPLISIDSLRGCERELRRAHHVLAFTVQLYAHTVPFTEAITIPRSLTIPLLQVSKELQHAPLITYFDHALNNWSHEDPCEENSLPASDNIRAQTTFTGTPDENELYMVDIRVELKGAEAIELLRSAVNEVGRCAHPDIERIAYYLQQAAVAINRMKEILMTTTNLVKPETFYREISPWLQGADTDAWGRNWTWNGSEEVADSAEMLTRTKGPNAGQSPLIPTLDAYLGVAEDPAKSSFLDRVRAYMLRSHDAFLQHIRSNGDPIRRFVEKIFEGQGAVSPVVTSYNAAIEAMKGFRDAHLVIVALYVVIPSGRAKRVAANVETEGILQNGAVIKGVWEGMEDNKFEATGPEYAHKHIGESVAAGREGSQLMGLLKGFRDQTQHASMG